MRLTPIIMLLIVAGCALTSTQGYVHEAESLAQEGRYEEAIEAYRAHMEERRADTDRPTWENPSFYLLAIGDLQLQQNNPSAARATYDEAGRQEVDPRLVTDRYLALALWYEDKGKLKEALGVLNVYRSRDPELLNGTFTRIAKKLTEQEYAEGSDATPR